MEDRCRRDSSTSSALGSAAVAVSAGAAAFGICFALAEPLFQKARVDQRLDLPALLDWPLLNTSCRHTIDQSANMTRDIPNIGIRTGCLRSTTESEVTRSSASALADQKHPCRSLIFIPERAVSPALSITSIRATGSPLLLAVVRWGRTPGTSVAAGLCDREHRAAVHVPGWWQMPSSSVDASSNVLLPHARHSLSQCIHFK